MPYFLMRCVHNPGQDSNRDQARPKHREWVTSGGDGLVSVLIGSAMLDAANEPAGHFGILEAASAEDALQFAENDPFNTEGVVAHIEITPLPESFQAQRISDRMTG